ncbi:hypothetical protein [Sinorhizobium terangae]|uniref:hypothetical protein n=1 Tax=Sinorhizobium terangae TaxID=110322 RepID=UPI0024B189A0|nr:hypothetical protein [Sinorhizobium terangae]WFU47562.1 hypothetical protein QA637_17145 [Sinorhizobium terangae]
MAVRNRGSTVLVVRDGNVLTLPKAKAKAGESGPAQSVPREPLRPELMRYVPRLRDTLKPVSRGVLALGVLFLLGAIYIHGFAIFRSWLMF